MKIPTPLRRSMPIQAATTQHHSAEPIGPQRMTANYPCRLFHPLAAVVVALIAMTSPARPIAQTSLPVIMSELDNPRGLAFAPNGALYVAEAGRGGAGPCRPVGAQTFCYGPTGAVSRWRNGVQQRIVEGLPSIAQAGTGTRATGPHDIAMLGVGAAYVTIGLEANPAVRNLFPEFAGFGRVVHVTPGGAWRFVADISAYEAAYNPDGRVEDADGNPSTPPTPVYDSNPYGVLATPGGLLVTDAGANTLFAVEPNGSISLLAVFHSRGTVPARPTFPGSEQFTDAVPTTVVAGPDGAYYVGELTGVPFVDRTANIYRVVLGQTPQLFLTEDACIAGFKMIIDMDFDAEGNLYVLQHSTGLTGGTSPGKVVRIAPDRSQPDACTQYRAGTRSDVVSGLTRPTSLLVGPDGALYISTLGSTAGAGEVVRVER